jgi:hypothetical protein
MNDPRGTLFGVPVEWTDSLRAGTVDVRGPIPFEIDEPPGWGLMDNGSRLVWLHHRHPRIRFVAGTGTTEAMLSDGRES